MSSPTRRRATLALGTALAVSVTGLVTSQALAAPSSTSVSPDVVISEVYGGGGNSGALLKRDFVELYNRGAAPVDVTGWSVQYASSTGTFNAKTDLAGVIPPGTHYLVAQAAGAGGTVDLPTPDVTGTIAMSGTGAKVALVTSTTLLPCGSDCDTHPTVRDFIGWGTTANDFEGARAVATTNPTSLTRDAAGTDTDNNLADLDLLEPPLPTNLAGETPDYGDPEVCGGATPVEAAIMEIQGAGHVSALDGSCVETTGVVTATKFDGYWVQDTAGDGDPTTSDGVYVFTTSSGEQPEVGQQVVVTGFVDEYRAATAALALTEIVDSEFEVTGTAALPTPVLLGPGGVEAPPQNVDDDSATRIDVEVAGSFDPATDAIDFYEQYEGMLVSLDSPEAIGPSNGFGELPVVPAGGADEATRTTFGGVAYGSYTTPNTMRVILDDEIIYQQMPDANTGDTIDGVVSGPLFYSFNNFKVQLTEVPTVIDNGLERDVAKKVKRKQLAVASFNVENLSPADDQAKFDALAAIVVDNLRSPDIVTLEEVQDNSGPTNDGTVDADQTLDLLVDAIAAAGGPTYAWAQISPEDGEDGGQPGGNIRNAFLYDTSRGLVFHERGEGDATTATEVVEGGDGQVELTLSPGRVDPLDPAWGSTRKPLAGEFSWKGEKVVVIANHFSSKGGDEPLYGRFQPPNRSSEDARHQQAASVNEFVDQLLAVDPGTTVVVAGDINDFEFSETVDILTDGGSVLTDLVAELKPKHRWTYVFDGNSQVLDHILVGGDVQPRLAKPVKVRKHYEVVHVSADFADQVSDHDPQVVRLKVG